jgi:hypothetical protein
MPEQEPTAADHLEHARELVWDAVQQLEEAQRVLFKAGDRYVIELWGDGVRAILEMAEKITDLSGDLTSCHIEIGRLGKRDKGRGSQPPEPPRWS